MKVSVRIKIVLVLRMVFSEVMTVDLVIKRLKVSIKVHHSDSPYVRTMLFKIVVKVFVQMRLPETLSFTIIY